MQALSIFSRSLVLTACLCTAQLAAAETVKIAFIDVLSGPFAQAGAGSLKQLREVVLQLNANSGPKDPKFEVVPFDDFESRRAGQLCGARGTRDVIDASVMVCAQERRHRVLTSDPEDLRALDPKTEIIAV